MKRKLTRAIALIMVLSMMVLPVSAAEVTTDPVEAAEVTAETLAEAEDVIQADEEATIELPYVDVNENDWFYVDRIDDRIRFHTFWTIQFTGTCTVCHDYLENM